MTADESGANLTLLLMSGAWYPENAYMTQLADGLRDAGVTVRTPELPVFFPLTRAVLANRDADVMQIDWIYDYYIVGDLRFAPLNKLATVLRAVTFLIDLAIVSQLDIAVVRTVHNKQHHEGIYPRTERLVNEWIFEIADAVTVKCASAADEIAEAFHRVSAERVHVVPDGNFIQAYENDRQPEAARRELGIAEDAFVFLYFGLIREYKGVPELIEAFGSIDAPGAECWIVGNPHNDRMKAQITALARGTDGVETRFTFVPDDRIQDYMNAADVLVLPYRKILNSGTAHLGLSFGVPIVAPAIGCVPDTVPDENEFIYDPSTPDGLASALQRAYEHPDLAEIGRANDRRARERGWDDACAELLGVYTRAVAVS